MTPCRLREIEDDAVTRARLQPTGRAGHCERVAPGP